MSFKVTLVDNQLVRTGRPDFISSTTKSIRVRAGEDRRHILHGATQISDVLIATFNRILSAQGINQLNQLLDIFLRNFRQRGIRFNRVNGLLEKVTKVITIAFSLTRNLVVGSAICNQGIEKARESIRCIREKLDEYCLELEQFNEFGKVKARALKLVIDSLSSTSDGEIAKHRIKILNILKDAVQNAPDAVTLIRVLADFELSCTLDIVHSNTTKKQNIWGITMANQLQQAICNRDNDEIFAILL